MFDQLSHFFRRVLPLIILVSCSSGYAQEVRKNRISASFWNAYKLDYELSESEVVFIEFGGRYNGTTNTIFSNGLLGKLASVQSAVGYQKLISENWKLGGYQRIFVLPNRINWHTRIFTGHVGKIGSLRFEKNLSLEYLTIGSDDNSATVENDLARLSVDFNFIKPITVGSKTFQAIFSYRSFWFKELKSSFEIYGGRFIDRTRLRLMIKYPILDQLSIEAFYIHNSDYFLISGITEERLNNLSSIIGMNLQLSLGEVTERKRLMIY